MKINSSKIVSIIIIITILYVFSKISFNLFHMSVEVTMLLLGTLIYTSAELSQKLRDKKFMKVVSIGIILSSIILFLHALTYKGMNLIPGYTANLPTQLWIIANAILAVSFVIGALFITIDINTKKVFYIVSVIGSIMVLLAFLRLFPDSYIEGSGLTWFKRISEYVIIATYMLAIYLLYKRKHLFEKTFLNSITIVLILLAGGELMFTLYSSVTDFLNFFGHILKFMGFLQLYWVIRSDNLEKPIRDLITNLKQEITRAEDSEAKSIKEKELSEKYLSELELVGSIFEVSIENAPIPIMVHAEDGTVLHISKAWTKLTKYTKSDIPTIYDWTEKAYGSKKEEVIDFIKMLYRLSHNQHDGEFIVTTKDGRQLTWDFNSGYVGKLPDGRAVAMSVATDVTERLNRENEIIFMSYHDSLTGLFNRRYYVKHLLEVDIPKNYPIAIVMSDINGLKLINDAFGHKSGDKLLISAAKLIQSSCRETDIVARIGGDEFVVIMLKTNAEKAEEIINEINKKAKKIKVESIELSISFGFDVKLNSGEDIQEIFRNAEDQMYRVKLIEIPSMRSGAINAILNTLNEKDISSEVHSRVVSEISGKIATAAGMNRQQINEIKTAGLLHDIGKIMIPLEIITKNGKLSEKEYEVIKNHPEIGFRILNSTHDMRNISTIVLSHHERWDGKGYPRGIKEENIPLQSRIIALADAYDAMTSQRTYREVFTTAQALEEIKRCSGTQFDPELIKVFTENFELIIADE